MNKCCYLTNENKCNGKIKYGLYCYKHRRNHLIDDNKLINHRFFTGLGKDYLKKDLENYYRIVLRKNVDKGIKKEELFIEIKNFINKFNKYNTSNNISKCIKIQSLMRGKIDRDKLMTNRCNNEEDFYTYDNLKDIDTFYFYSYEDKNNIRWGFDIRSLDKLIDMNYPNPYTTELISPRIIMDVKNKMEILKKDIKYEDLTDIIQKDRKNSIKQKVVDLFSQIEQSGHTCQVDWFMSLSIRRLKELYKQLEDLWNYRAQLSNEMKREICPPDGRLFTTPIIDIMNMDQKEDIQEIIINDINKFNNCQHEGNRKLGYMYFIIGLGNVSSQCYIAHQDWLIFIQ